MAVEVLDSTEDLCHQRLDRPSLMVEQTVLLILSVHVEPVAPAVELFTFDVVIEDKVAFIKDAFDKKIAIHSTLKARKETGNANSSSNSLENTSHKCLRTSNWSGVKSY